MAPCDSCRGGNPDGESIRDKEDQAVNKSQACQWVPKVQAAGVALLVTAAIATAVMFFSPHCIDCTGASQDEPLVAPVEELPAVLNSTLQTTNMLKAEVNGEVMEEVTWTRVEITTVVTPDKEMRLIEYLIAILRIEDSQQGIVFDSAEHGGNGPIYRAVQSMRTGELVLLEKPEDDDPVVQSEVLLYVQNLFVERRATYYAQREDDGSYRHRLLSATDDPVPAPPLSVVPNGEAHVDRTDMLVSNDTIALTSSYKRRPTLDGDDGEQDDSFSDGGSYSDPLHSNADVDFNQTTVVDGNTGVILNSTVLAQSSTARKHARDMEMDGNMTSLISNVNISSESSVNTTVVTYNSTDETIRGRFLFQSMQNVSTDPRQMMLRTNNNSSGNSSSMTDDSMDDDFLRNATREEYAMFWNETVEEERRHRQLQQLLHDEDALLSEAGYENANAVKRQLCSPAPAPPRPALNFRQWGLRLQMAARLTSLNVLGRQVQVKANVASDVCLSHPQKAIFATGSRSGIFVKRDQRLSDADQLSTIYVVKHGAVVETLYGYELPWRDNTKFVSSIATGPYKGRVVPNYPGKGTVVAVYTPGDYRCGGPGCWDVKQNGEERNNVMFHVGNYENDVQGCIAPGESRIPQCRLANHPSRGAARVCSSTNAMNRISNHLASVGEFSIVIADCTQHPGGSDASVRAALDLEVDAGGHRMDLFNREVSRPVSVARKRGLEMATMAEARELGVSGGRSGTIPLIPSMCAPFPLFGMSVCGGLGIPYGYSYNIDVPSTSANARVGLAAHVELSALVVRVGLEVGGTIVNAGTRISVDYNLDTRDLSKSSICPNWNVYLNGLSFTARAYWRAWSCSFRWCCSVRCGFGGRRTIGSVYSSRTRGFGYDILPRCSRRQLLQEPPMSANLKWYQVGGPATSAVEADRMRIAMISQRIADVCQECD